MEDDTRELYEIRDRIESLILLAYSKDEGFAMTFVMDAIARAQAVRSETRPYAEILEFPRHAG
jgi:hypothetical protein